LGGRLARLEKNDDRDRNGTGSALPTIEEVKALPLEDRIQLLRDQSSAVCRSALPALPKEVVALLLDEKIRLMRELTGQGS
jgi:hypothetical protein